MLVKKTVFGTFKVEKKFVYFTLAEMRFRTRLQSTSHNVILYTLVPFALIVHQF